MLWSIGLEEETMTTDPKVELLRRVPLFGTCPHTDLQRIAALADEIDVPAGKRIIAEGTTGQEFFIIIEGEVRVERGGAELRTLGPGEFLGEIALVDDRPRSASAIVTKPSRLLVIGHREFHSLLDAYPSIQLQVLQALAARVRAVQPQQD